MRHLIQTFGCDKLLFLIKERRCGCNRFPQLNYRTCWLPSTAEVLLRAHVFRQSSRSTVLGSLGFLCVKRLLLAKSAVEPFVCFFLKTTLLRRIKHLSNPRCSAGAHDPQSWDHRLLTVLLVNWIVFLSKVLDPQSWI